MRGRRKRLLKEIYTRGVVRIQGKRRKRDESMVNRGSGGCVGGRDLAAAGELDMQVNVL